VKGKKGKLLFVVPLASPNAVSSWHQVEQLFERTLRSICGQTSPNFAVVVACHERPRIGFDHHAVQFLEVDKEVPGDDHESRVLDRDIKIRLALHRGLGCGATHTMVVDADDCVSCRLSEHVSRHPSACGWYFKKGYFFSQHTGMLWLRTGDFHRWTGTSYIIRSDIYSMPESLVAADFADTSLFGKTYYVRHSRGISELRELGIRLRPLPFAGAVYVVDHGSNLGAVKESVYHLKGLPFRIKQAIFNKRRLTNRIRTEFGLYDLAEAM